MEMCPFSSHSLYVASRIAFAAKDTYNVLDV